MLVLLVTNRILNHPLFNNKSNANASEDAPIKEEKISLTEMMKEKMEIEINSMISSTLKASNERALRSNLAILKIITTTISSLLFIIFLVLGLWLISIGYIVVGLFLIPMSISILGLIPLYRFFIKEANTYGKS